MERWYYYGTCDACGGIKGTEKAPLLPTQGAWAAGNAGLRQPIPVGYMIAGTRTAGDCHLCQGDRNACDCALDLLPSRQPRSEEAE
jgi:hypothetical protein